MNESFSMLVVVEEEMRGVDGRLLAAAVEEVLRVLRSVRSVEEEDGIEDREDQAETSMAWTSALERVRKEVTSEGRTEVAVGQAGDDCGSL